MICKLNAIKSHAWSVLAYQTQRAQVRYKRDHQDGEGRRFQLAVSDGLSCDVYKGTQHEGSTCILYAASAFNVTSNF